MLDLTDPAVRATVGLEEADLIGDDYTKTQAVAAAAAVAGFAGLLALSAALSGLWGSTTSAGSYLVGSA